MIFTTKYILLNVSIFYSLLYSCCSLFDENNFLMFRNLQYSVKFHLTPVVEKNTTGAYEYVVQGLNKYICSIELLKRHAENESAFKLSSKSPINPTLNTSETTLTIQNQLKTYEDLVETLFAFKNKCSLAVPMNNHEYIYLICYYAGITRFQFRDNFHQNVTDIGRFSSDQFWTTDELNMRNVNFDSLITTEGTHTQTYISNVTCPNEKFHMKDNFYKTTLKFQCNNLSNITKVTNIVELTPCHVEISILTSLLCDFPVFNRNVEFSDERSNIDCYPLVSKKYAKFIDLVRFSKADQSRHVLESLFNNMAPRFILPLYSKLGLLGKIGDGEILKNTKFVTQILPDTSEILTSETSGKIQNGYFKTKIKLHKNLNLLSNAEFKTNVDQLETIRYLESINITDLFEATSASLKNSIIPTKSKSNSNINTQDPDVDDDEVSNEEDENNDEPHLSPPIDSIDSMDSMDSMDDTKEVSSPFKKYNDDQQSKASARIQFDNEHEYIEVGELVKSNENI